MTAGTRADALRPTRRSPATRGERRRRDRRARRDAPDRRARPGQRPRRTGPLLKAGEEPVPRPRRQRHRRRWASGARRRCWPRAPGRDAVRRRRRRQALVRGLHEGRGRAHRRLLHADQPRRAGRLAGVRPGRDAEHAAAARRQRRRPRRQGRRSCCSRRRRRPGRGGLRRRPPRTADRLPAAVTGHRHARRPAVRPRTVAGHATCATGPATCRAPGRSWRSTACWPRTAPSTRSEIVELSKAMYVMTPFTSLLVLENEADVQAVQGGPRPQGPLGDVPLPRADRGQDRAAAGVAALRPPPPGATPCRPPGARRTRSCGRWPSARRGRC